MVASHSRPDATQRIVGERAPTDLIDHLQRGPRLLRRSAVQNFGVVWLQMPFGAVWAGPSEWVVRVVTPVGGYSRCVSRLRAARCALPAHPLGLDSRFPESTTLLPHMPLHTASWRTCRGWAKRHPERVLVQFQLHRLSVIGEPPQTPFLPRATLTAGTKRYQPHLGTLMIACVQLAGRLEVRRCIVEQTGPCLLKVHQHTAYMSDVLGGV